MNEPKRYPIRHITDLADIPPEHWAEAVEDIMTAIAILYTMRDENPDLVLRSLCPEIVFVADGKHEQRPHFIPADLLPHDVVKT